MMNRADLAELVRHDVEESQVATVIDTATERIQEEPSHKTNVLIVGSGAREHALLWSLERSKTAGTIYVAPGNGGTGPHNVNIEAKDIERLYEFARDHDCITVPGPELPLALGIVDYFVERGMPIFGPTMQQAKLEWSKAYAKNFMKENNIPTSEFAVFTDSSEAIAYASKRNWNVAVKADGLADGKGVFMCSSESEVRIAITDILDKGVFNGANRSVVVEERLSGPELSVFALCDGNKAVYMGSAVDHKRRFDRDRGPNTGGMGAFSPSGLATLGLIGNVMANIADVVVEQTGYKGFLYLGLMLTGKGPMVLEFNARLGDPEAQVILPTLKFDLLKEISIVSDGGSTRIPTGNVFNGTHACAVSMCSEDYPFDRQESRGKQIVIGDQIRSLDAVVFHAGTKISDGKLATNGGRVLSVTGLGATLADARRNAYAEVSMIDFDGKDYRKDIGSSEAVHMRLRH